MSDWVGVVEEKEEEDERETFSVAVQAEEAMVATGLPLLNSRNLFASDFMQQ